MSTDLSWSPPGIPDLVRALENADLTNVTWESRFGTWESRFGYGGVEVTSRTWARRSDEEQGAAAARRGLVELAEHTISIVEERGFQHAVQPDYIIAHVTKPTGFGHRSGYELTLQLRVRPPAGDTIPTPAGDERRSEPVVPHIKIV
ncbi:hypothetical protein ACIHFD_49675 [Nonomuraea sp. NPDC051941]|uniref:hypothetical protein n=1 Tax=Nonomuraea sp. NPDC051941 TaxID=3364373 RepID=UPI0037C74454